MSHKLTVIFGRRLALRDNPLSNPPLLNSLSNEDILWKSLDTPFSAAHNKNKLIQFDKNKPLPRARTGFDVCCYICFVSMHSDQSEIFHIQYTIYMRKYINMKFCAKSLTLS